MTPEVGLRGQVVDRQSRGIAKASVWLRSATEAEGSPKRRSGSDPPRRPDAGTPSQRSSTPLRNTDSICVGGLSALPTCSCVYVPMELHSKEREGWVGSSIPPASASLLLSAFVRMQRVWINLEFGIVLSDIDKFAFLHRNAGTDLI